jgi:hypothetical protein
MMNHLKIPTKELEDFCQKHHIKKLSLFGSFVREDFSDKSDIDILVEFDPKHIPGLKIILMQDELSEIFGGKKVDLVTPKSLNPLIRKKITTLPIVDD